VSAGAGGIAIGAGGAEDREQEGAASHQPASYEGAHRGRSTPASELAAPFSLLEGAWLARR